MAEKLTKDTPRAAARRTGPLQFLQEVRREASKVTWPTRKETTLTTIMVFIMVAIATAFFFAVDWLLGNGIRLLLSLG